MLHEWFLASARRFPGEPALIVAGSQLSYAELDQMSRAIGTLLPRARDSQPRIGLLATRSAIAYAAYLAILRRGGVVVPLDAAYPRERLASIADAARMELVIADQDQDASFADGTSVRVLRLAPGQPIKPVGDPGPDWGGSDDDGVYLLFTSGSSGHPKGVPIRHGNLDEFVRFNIARYQPGPGSRLSQTFHLTFDPSVFDMFVAWGSGAALVVPSADDLFDPVAFVNRHQITHWYSVPSLIALATDAGLLPEASMPSLRWSLFCGEQFSLARARVWAEAAPGSTLENLYGPTELTVTVAAYRLPAERSRWPSTPNGTVPIGTVYPHLEYRVDADGELLIRGPQRFAGYLDQADNAGRFTASSGAHPALGQDQTCPGPGSWYRTGDRVGFHDGALVHLGRLDRQVKFRGYRIELHEIEGALRTYGGADDAVVLPAGSADGIGELAAVCAGSDLPPLAELRNRLRQHLPLHMVPRRFVLVDRLPVNDRGKIDYLACSALLARAPRRAAEHVGWPGASAPSCDP